MENIWTRLDLDDPTIFCRWGHSTGFVNNRYMLVYGGINHQNFMVRDSFVFDMYEFYVIELEEEGDKPVVRLTNSNLLESGNGMMTLYGGEDYERKGHYTDIWHLTVKVLNISEGAQEAFKATVQYTKVNYESSDYN